MTNQLSILNFFGWFFGLIVFSIGLANLVWVHPVPGLFFLLLSVIFLPPVNALLKKKLGFAIPMLVKIILGIFIIMFTLGVSDLGDMIDKL